MGASTLASPVFARCPKCQHAPLPRDQALPAACPRCGVILAKVAQAARPPALTAADPAAGRAKWEAPNEDDGDTRPKNAIQQLLLHGPERVDSFSLWGRMLLWVAFFAWGMVLIALDYRTGEIASSFLHRPLLIFHEAGHVVFRPFGEWMMFMGGTLGQLLMPAVMGGALLLKNRDPFGAAIGLWLFGVSLLDIAPYMYDAREPQLTLLNGESGEAGGHDWIYLFNSVGWLAKSQAIGGLTHKLGALVVLLALGWAGWVLRNQFARRQN